MTADIHLLTGAYAADALPDDERRFFEQHLGVCAACAQEVTELQATAARLGAAAAEPPPPALRARVLAQIDQTRQEAPPPREEHAGPAGGAPWWQRLLVPAAAIVAVVAVGLGVLVGDLRGRLDALEQDQTRVAELMAAPDAQWVEHAGEGGALVRVVVAPSRGEAMLLVDNMPPAPHEHVYELWLIDDAGATPAALFDVDDDGRVSRMLDGDFAGTAAIGVTIEPDGGSPQPSGDPVMVLELDT
ncbi:anti-sigma factor [Egicoccus halophilus]|uniref:Regulator of SigK n=1 Tax=Egicoccus halophilus TaxID=1670830 RepID=A0A8J3ADX3_9ACTN|nr:anti-sigma factor [Egicoccus halophilus]GGI05695.1 hypothetical protein GCM10011354_15370 [Egicoccus halophilus]